MSSLLPCIKNQSPNNGLQGPASDASPCSSPCSLLSSHTASSLFLSHQAHSCILARALVLPSAWNISSPKGSCGFLIHLPQVFIQVSPSLLHPIRPPYLNLEDLHLALHIKLPSLLVSVVLLTILQTIWFTYLWCMCIASLTNVRDFIFLIISVSSSLRMVCSPHSTNTEVTKYKNELVFASQNG